MPSESPHQICMRSNQRFIRYRAHNLYEGNFYKYPPPLSAILFLINSSQKLVRSSEIPGEPAYKI